MPRRVVGYRWRRTDSIPAKRPGAGAGGAGRDAPLRRLRIPRLHIRQSRPTTPARSTPASRGRLRRRAARRGRRVALRATVLRRVASVTSGPCATCRRFRTGDSSSGRAGQRGHHRRQRSNRHAICAVLRRARRSENNPVEPQRSRSPRRWVDWPRGSDVEVHAPRCDITDRAMVSAVAADYAGDGASLLIHAAGIARYARMLSSPAPTWRRVCAAKVAGLARMVDVWPMRPDCRILACSSVFGVWGGHGHAAYAASNRMLDVLAAQLRDNGLDCTAIRWGLWQDAGSRRCGRDRPERALRSDRDAIRIWRSTPVCARYADDPLIFDADFDRLQMFFESSGNSNAVQHCRRARRRSDGETTPERRSLARWCVPSSPRHCNSGDSASIDPSSALIDLGLDSLLALDLRKRLRRTVGRSVPVAAMLGGITVNELIDGCCGCSPDRTASDMQVKVGILA